VRIRRRKIKKKLVLKEENNQMVQVEVEEEVDEDDEEEDEEEEESVDILDEPEEEEEEEEEIVLTEEPQEEQVVVTVEEEEIPLLPPAQLVRDADLAQRLRDKHPPLPHVQDQLDVLKRCFQWTMDELVVVDAAEQTVLSGHAQEMEDADPLAHALRVVRQAVQTRRAKLNALMAACEEMDSRHLTHAQIARMLHNTLME
jgi:hypothetical protein